MTTASHKKVESNSISPDRRRGGEVRVLLSPKTIQSTSGFGGLLTLEPGEYVCEHIHPYSEEFVYLMRGSVTMRIADEEIEMSAGDALMVPKDTRHRVRNSGTEPVQIVFHLGPLAPRPELGHIDTEFLPGTESDAQAKDVG